MLFKSILFLLILVTTPHIFAGTITSINAERLDNATVNFAQYKPKYQDTVNITINEDSALEIRIKVEDIRNAGMDPLQFANLLVNSNLKMIIERNGAYFEIVSLLFAEKKRNFLNWE